MKYKKHIATSALAISLLVGGSSVMATTPQDLGIKNVQQFYQKQNKNGNNLKVRNRRNNNIVGTVGAISDTGFTVNIMNLKTKTASSVDVITNQFTVYKKGGLAAGAPDLSIGQKVAIVGIMDKTTNILTAKNVKIAKNGSGISRSKTG